MCSYKMLRIHIGVADFCCPASCFSAGSLQGADASRVVFEGSVPESRSHCAPGSYFNIRSGHDVPGSLRGERNVGSM